MFVLQGGESILSKDFRAFWSVIPATVLDDMSIPANAKILYGVLSSLMRREGYCWPSNAQLAEAMHCSEDVVKRWVSALAEAGHIRVRIEPNRKVGGKIRYISPVLAEPSITLSQNGYGDECPGTYGDKNPLVGGQTSPSIYKDGYKKENKKKKKKEKPQSADAVASALLDRCDTYGADVRAAMSNFLGMRKELDKPLVSERSATMLWNKLIKLSSGDPQHMLALFERAVENQWLSLYQLKPDELAQLHRAAPADNAGRVDLSGVEFV